MRIRVVLKLKKEYIVMSMAEYFRRGGYLKYKIGNKKRKIIIDCEGVEIEPHDPSLNPCDKHSDCVTLKFLCDDGGYLRVNASDIETIEPVKSAAVKMAVNDAETPAK